MGRNSGGTIKQYRGTNKKPQKLIKSAADFYKQKPVLYGGIVVNGKFKTGMFKPEYNKYTNSIQYRYYTEKGKKGTGGLTLNLAYKLYSDKKLKTTKIEYV